MRKTLFATFFSVASIFSNTTQQEDIQPIQNEPKLCENTGSNYKMNTSFRYNRTHAYFTDCATGKHYAYECNTMPLVIAMARVASKNNNVMAKNTEQYTAANEYYCSTKKLG